VPIGPTPLIIPLLVQQFVGDASKGAYVGGPIVDSAGYGLLFSIYGMLFLLSILALKGVQLKPVPEEGA
jgi:putative effector of murein hydrolase LrgA (UPF0299 family)